MSQSTSPLALRAAPLAKPAYALEKASLALTVPSVSLCSHRHCRTGLLPRSASKGQPSFSKEGGRCVGQGPSLRTLEDQGSASNVLRDLGRVASLSVHHSTLPLKWARGPSVLGRPRCAASINLAFAARVFYMQQAWSPHQRPMRIASH